MMAPKCKMGDASSFLMIFIFYFMMFKEKFEYSRNGCPSPCTISQDRINCDEGSVLVFVKELSTLGSHPNNK